MVMTTKYKDVRYTRKTELSCNSCGNDLGTATLTAIGYKPFDPMVFCDSDCVQTYILERLKEAM